ncbi:hypothetical protein [Asticcacaulis sp. EMRT-3]|uniref:hypothetical protein n=1 Tax=Asticcacaulis sp. EMRT-3 TaxID=3040349 RepID=UPI0024AFC559|nr:hypothetical protein [Asticcacaulis sp. EMRT-3]MDI7775447.1 hypothetical protein [Asticcacaulis sp. EMRT-3]
MNDLLHWTPENTAKFSRKNLLFRHDLDKSDLFTDEALIALIDRYPRDRLEVFSMGYDPANWGEWYLGRRGEMDGRTLMEGVKTGRLWLNLRKVNHADAGIAALCDTMFAEIRAKAGVATLKQDLGLLISSPNAHVFYHLDIPLVMLWQVRGVKRLYLYPPHVQCVSDRHMEGVALRESDEQLPYDPAFDAHALIHDLKPGEMMTWQQNAPHRIVNHGVVNVSLSIEFMTPRALWRANVLYANGVLRRWFGLNPSMDRSPKWLEPLKVIFARLVKQMGGYRGHKSPLKARFSLDPAAPGQPVFDADVMPPKRPRTADQSAA